MVVIHRKYVLQPFYDSHGNNSPKNYKNLKRIVWNIQFKTEYLKRKQLTCAHFMNCISAINLRMKELISVIVREYDI